MEENAAAADLELTGGNLEETEEEGKSAPRVTCVRKMRVTVTWKREPSGTVSSGK